MRIRNRKWAVIGGVLYVALLSYDLVITRQLLLFAAFAEMFLAPEHLVWRFLAVVEVIANALQRIAGQRGQD